MNHNSTRFLKLHVFSILSLEVDFSGNRCFFVFFCLFVCLFSVVVAVYLSFPYDLLSE